MAHHRYLKNQITKYGYKNCTFTGDPDEKNTDMNSAMVFLAPRGIRREITLTIERSEAANNIFKNRNFPDFNNRFRICTFFFGFRSIGLNRQSRNRILK